MSTATGFCQGSPLRGEIETARKGTSLSEATEACAAAIADRFGHGPIDGNTQALIVTATS